MAADLFLTGDVMLGRGVDQILGHPSKPDLHEDYADSAIIYVGLAEKVAGPLPRRADPAYVWGDALSILNKLRPAARIINLETAITTSEDWCPKGINYRMHPDNVASLRAAQIDCCVLANNHVLDWGEEGLLETLASLRRSGIAAAGAGHDAAKASAPAAIPLANGGRILVFGLATSNSGVPRDWAAGADRPGINLLTDLTPQTAARLTEVAAAHQRPGDLLIASIHWGSNWGYDVPAEQRAFAHALIDGGFDLVHGHSSHHPKGIELYRDKLILYGCGDFINDYEGISSYEEFRGDLVLMYLPHIETATGRLLSLKMVPMRIMRFQLRRPLPADAEWLHRVLTRESRTFGTEVILREDGSFMIDRGGTLARA